MLQDSTDTSTSRLPQSPPSSSVGTVTSSQSSNADKDSLGKWIDQERARLKEEEAELDSEASQIDIEHQLLDQKVNELNSGSPSQEEIDSYEADRRRFNGRVQAHNARLGRHEADVTSFNAQIERYNSMP
jgi:chromosome segregation ATPase